MALRPSTYGVGGLHAGKVLGSLNLRAAERKREPKFIDMTCPWTPAFLHGKAHLKSQDSDKHRAE